MELRHYVAMLLALAVVLGAAASYAVPLPPPLPSIDVEKYVSVDAEGPWDDADTAPGLYVLAGDKVYFRFVVTNTGNVVLSNITLSDSFYDDAIDCPSKPDALAPGDFFECVIGPFAAEAGQHTNTATATDTVWKVSDTDDANYFGATPGIDIEKYVSVDGKTTWEDADDALGPYVYVGSPVWYQFVVTNTGNVVLSNITLSDSVYGAIDCPSKPDALAPGSSFACDIGPFAAEAGLHTNTATAKDTVWDVSDTDDANYFGATPGIDIEKYVSVDGKTTWEDADDALGPYVYVGSPVWYQFVVTNTGNVPLENVVLSDTPGYLGDCVAPAVLVVDEPYICTSGPWAAELGLQTDVATVWGDFLGVTYSKSDSANYNGTLRLCTYTQGAYANKGAPGKMFNKYFTAAFPAPAGLEVGYYSSPEGTGLRWEADPTGLANLKNFLAGGGPSAAITGHYLNPTGKTGDSKSDTGGVLAKQTATLTINVTLGGLLGTGMPGGLGSLYFCQPDSPLNGLTVNEILALANQALGGLGLPAGCTFDTLNTVITNINEGFDNCTATEWARVNLRPTL
jgi:hypothetical protein